MTLPIPALPETLCETYPQLTTALSPHAPCGNNPDDNPQFLMLLSGLHPKPDAEYGDFYAPAAPVNWAECRKLSASLLLKSKDVRLIVILMRCRLRDIGLPALAEGLLALLHLLHCWPEHLHPQLYDDGEFTPQLRANAFAELDAPQGLLADIRQMLLPAISGQQITVSEFEKAFSQPCATASPSGTIAGELLKQWQDTANPEILALQQAGEFLQQLQCLLETQLEQHVPETRRLAELLSLFTPGKAAENAVTVSAPQPAILSGQQKQNAFLPSIPTEATGNILKIGHRQDALEYLRQLRHWFSEAEPGSPAIPMLSYIEAGVGRSFSELVAMYPPEIMSLLKNH